MNIVYIAPIRLPTERAHGYAIMKLCAEFAKLGHMVELVVPNKWAPALKEKDPFVYYKMERTFTVTRVPSSDFLGAEEGRGKIAFYMDLVTFICSVRLRMGKKLRSADVIYTRDYTLVGFLPFNKVALEVHDIPARSARFVQAAQRATWVVAISKGVQQKIKEVSNVDALVAPDAVDLDTFSNFVSKDDARRELGLPQDKQIALYMGHLYGWKGANIFAEAASKLPDVVSVLVGGVEPDLQQFTDTYAKYKNILIVPFQHPSRMPLYLAAANLVVLPNRSDSEISATYTSPLKLFEYMAAGKPIVASDLPSIREVLDETTAVLVRPDSPEALAEGICAVLGNEVEAAKRAQAARAKVEHYTWANRAKTILDFIK